MECGKLYRWIAPSDVVHFPEKFPENFNLQFSTHWEFTQNIRNLWGSKVITGTIPENSILMFLGKIDIEDEPSFPKMAFCLYANRLVMLRDSGLQKT